MSTWARSDRACRTIAGRSSSGGSSWPRIRAIATAPSSSPISSRCWPTVERSRRRSGGGGAVVCGGRRRPGAAGLGGGRFGRARSPGRVPDGRGQAAAAIRGRTPRALPIAPPGRRDPGPLRLSRDRGPEPRQRLTEALWETARLLRRTGALATRQTCSTPSARPCGRTARRASWPRWRWRRPRRPRRRLRPVALGRSGRGRPPPRSRPRRGEPPPGRRAGLPRPGPSRKKPRRGLLLSTAPTSARAPRGYRVPRDPFAAGRPK